MKKIIFCFLVLLFAVWLGILMHNNPGYVLISTGNTSIETSFWFFVVALIVFFSIIYALLRFSSGAGRMTYSLKNWISSRRKRRAYAQTVLGLYEFVEGNWKGAEKKLTHFAKHSDMSLINYLVAALTAERQRDFKRRDDYLRLAKSVAKDRPLAIKLIDATLKIGNGEWERALPILEEANKNYPKNVFILDLLRQVYLELNDWHGLKKILSSLRKRHVLEEDTIDHLEDKVYGELLLENSRGDKMVGAWDGFPRNLKKRPYLLAIYSEYLLGSGKDEEAEDLTKMVLRKNLDKKLLSVYSNLTSSNPIKHLMRAEKWLSEKPNNVDLLLCLGRICRKQKLWGKSRHYLEEIIKIDPTSQAYIELAELMAEQNDLKGAVEFYEKAVE